MQRTSQEAEVGEDWGGFIRDAELVCVCVCVCVCQHHVCVCVCRIGGKNGKGVRLRQIRPFFRCVCTLVLLYRSTAGERNPFDDFESSISEYKCLMVYSKFV